MKHTTSFALALALLPFAVAGQALADIPDIQASDRAIELDAGGSNLQYGETSGGTSLDTESGWMPAIRAGVTWLTPPSQPIWHDVYLHADLLVKYGFTNYNGHLQDNNGNILGPYSTDTNNQIYTLTGQIGRSFIVSDSLILTPLVDFGFRDWRRDIHGAYPDDEEYENGQGLGGLLVQWSPLPQWVFSATGEYGMTFGASMYTNASHVDLGSSEIYKVSGKIGYAITPRFEWVNGFEYDGFGFGHSGEGIYSIGGGYGELYVEPRSYTHELTATTGVAYHFH